MRLYLSGQSALSVLRYLRSIGDERLSEAPVRIKTLTQPVTRASQLAALSDEATRILSRLDAPIHALVPDKTSARLRGKLACHLWSGRIQGGSFIRITQDLYVSSPAFTFLQMASIVDYPALLELGMELCGSYARIEQPDRYVRYSFGDVRDVIFQVPPLVPLQRLRAFVGSASGARGSKTARAALRSICDGSASPMESAAFLLLTLPKRMGGYGLPAPVLNPIVTLKTEHGPEQRSPDLFWPKQAVDVEYDSDFAHSGEWKRYRDSRREVLLTSNRITVLPLTRAQLMNVDDFHDFAMGLRRLLGVRKRDDDGGWEWRRAELRKALLHLG